MKLTGFSGPDVIELFHALLNEHEKMRLITKILWKIKTFCALKLANVVFIVPINENLPTIVSTQMSNVVVEEPGFKNVKYKHLGMPPF